MRLCSIRPICLSLNEKMRSTRLQNLQHLPATFQSVFGACPATIYRKTMWSFTCVYIQINVCRITKGEG
jgi:hypothetical protein